MTGEPRPLVSIIIPAYNAARFVRRSIDSALKQTYSPCEIIVVNDGSKDDTEGVCKTYGDSIRLITQPNRGEGGARNRGIAEARGAAVGFLDADDEYLPNMVETLMEGMMRFPQAGAVSGAHIILEPGQPPIRAPRAGVVLPPGESMGLVKDFFDLYAHWNLVCVGSALVRREIVEQVGGFREGLRRGADREFWSRIAGKFSWAYVEREVLRYYRSPENSISQTYPEAEAPREIATFVYPEDEMRTVVDPRLWESYRRFRRDSILFACRYHYSRLPGKTLRAAMKIIPPAPRSFRWAMTAALSYVPLPLRRALVGARRAIRRRGAPPPNSFGPGSGADVMKHGRQERRVRVHPATRDPAGAGGPVDLGPPRAHGPADSR